MDFGGNFLPSSGWTLNNATMAPGNLTLNAGGSASISFTILGENNLLPNALWVSAKATKYPKSYAPTAFIRVDIYYEFGDMFSSLCPIVDIDEEDYHTLLIIPASHYMGLDTNAFSKITFTIFANEKTTLTEWISRKSLNDFLLADRTYYGVFVTREKGLVIERGDGESVMTVNSDVWEVRVNNERVLYIDYLSKPPRLVFNGELGAYASSVINQRITNEVTTINAAMASMELSITNGFNVKLQNEVSTINTAISKEVSTINTKMASMELSITNGFNVKLAATEQRITNEVTTINAAMAELRLTLDGFFTSIRDIQGNLASLSLQATKIEMLVGGSSSTNLTLNQNQITLQSNIIDLKGKTIKIGESSSLIGFFGATPVTKRTSSASSDGSRTTGSISLASSVVTSLSTSSQPSSVVTGLNTGSQPSTVVTGISVSTSSFNHSSSVVTYLNVSTSYLSGFGTVVTGVSYSTTNLWSGYIVTGVSAQTSSQPSSVATTAQTGSQPSTVVTSGYTSYQSAPGTVVTGVTFGNMHSSITSIRDALISYGLL